jgi:hypothetical protein
LSVLAPLAARHAVGGAPQAPIAKAQPSLGIEFAGLGNTATQVPSDSDIAVGPTDVFEIAEPDFQIFSTNGTPLTSPQGVNVLWSGSEVEGQPNGPCSQLQTGDWSQVIYDQLAGKFVYARAVHVITDGEAAAYECLAVSETSDPTGSWYLYTMPLASGNSDQTDYPQLGFSASAYYLSTNLWTGAGGTGTFMGDLLVAYNRTELLSGQDVQYAVTTLPNSYESFTPATLEGQTAEPSGMPELYVGGPNDFLMTNGENSSTLSYFEATPDWSTGTLLVQGPSTINVGSYNLKPCAQAPNCAPQPGTSTELEAWTDNLMLPLVYRNFGSYQSIVGTFDVNYGGTPEPEWFEIRLTPSGQASLYQKDVYAPGPASRYNQSIAEDNNGNIVLAYTISSSTVYPGIAVAAHLAGTAPGAMTAEDLVFHGGASQTSTSVGLPTKATPSRWGDASYLALAPDGCTLWYSAEYYASTSEPWQTEIISGAVPGCTSSSGAGSAGSTALSSSNGPSSGGTSTTSSSASAAGGGGPGVMGGRLVRVLRHFL